MSLQIKIQGGFLDLYSSDRVVQTFSNINLEDITRRESEYSNTFNIPNTNNNLRLLGYSNYLNSLTDIPYNKINCSIFIDGFLFKPGFVQLISIAKDISIRFYTGNAGFFDKLKQKKISEVDVVNTPSLLTNWDLFSAVNSRALTSGAFFALIDYGQLPTSGNVVDVRELLPSYYKKTLIEAMIVDAGYTLDNQITGDTLTQYNKDIVPTAKNKLGNTAETITENSYRGDMLTGTIDLLPRHGTSTNQPFTTGQTDTLQTGLLYHTFSTYNSGDANNYFPSTNGQHFFQCGLDGTYNINYDLDVTAVFTNNWSSTPNYDWTSRCSIRVYVNGNYVHELGSIERSTVNGSAQTSLTGTANIVGTKTLALNAGDNVRLLSFCETTIHVGTFNGVIYLTNSSDVTMSNGNFFEVELDAGITFGTQLFPSQTLADINQADFFKDTCIRYCIVPSVNEDTKVVSLIQFTAIKDNIPNAVDWTDKVDETNIHEIAFELGNYAQKNYMKHKEDKRVENVPAGSDYVIGIENQNLEFEKTIYTSCFAPSETVERLGTDDVMIIDIHDGTGFKNDVQPRTGFVRLINRTIDYTDGVDTTTVTTNIPLTWFISDDRDYSAGFDKTLREHSVDLIAILQRMKVVSIDVRINILDILNLNYFYPIYLNQLNAYFILGKINQFDYTSNDSTTVQLIKIN